MTQTTAAPTPTFTWRTPDVFNIVLGVIMLLAPAWMGESHPAWQIPLGIITIIVGLWAVVTKSAVGVEKVMVAVAVGTFFSPFLGLYGNTLATWHAWFTGVLLFATAMLAIDVAGRR
ncbi:MAG: hypothetical protein Q4G50_12835 [Corynebacterium sp.]|uniref:SPW repeat domain-containing protein n=1 Tax=Corynebacterium sp. TaxID=1720 RepID=UPI0026E03083|nr:hypothetical protein [Corynebacterium sp.]MDO5670871.1 hypothetical protein [Corynebacterium sp.]